MTEQRGVDSAPVSLSELRELLDGHRRVIERLEAEGRLSARELQQQRRLEALAAQELVRRTAPPPRDAMESLWPAIAAWDLFNFEVAQSHRGTFTGRVITRGKRVFVDGLRGFHRGLVAPQRAFNQALLDRLHAAVAGNTAQARLIAAGQLRAALDPLKGATLPQPATLAERAYQGALRSWLQPALDRQSRWNAEVIDVAVAALATGGVSLPALHELLGRLRELGRLPKSDEVTGPARRAFPLWIELLRKQETFNQSIAKTLASLHQLPRPADDGRYTYPRTLLGAEGRRIAEVADEIRALAQRPKFSLITPTYRTPVAVLRSCLDSVLAQSYQEWELCLVDDGSHDPVLEQVLREYERKDPRIRVQLNPSNGGIAAATNAALGLATGDWVAFLDHDDVIAPHALGEIALHLAAAPATDFLYTDEDRLDLSGRRVMPFFKPQWSPDLLQACNYVCHFLVARRTLIEAVGGIRPGFEGAQDYDLILRLSERARQVGHVSGVLYHWRAGSQSTAMNIANKPAAGSAGIRALTEHLARTGVAAEVVSPSPTYYRVRYPLPRSTEVAVVVPSPRTGAPLLVTVGQSSHRGHKLVAIGGDAAADVRVPWAGPTDVGAMYEAARRKVAAAVYVFAHDTVAVEDPDWLRELAGNALRPEIGVVGPKLINSDATIQDAGWVFEAGGAGSKVLALRPFEHMADLGEWTSMGSPNWTRNYLAVSPVCFAVRSEVLAQLGGFRAGLGAAETVFELCFRAHQAGLRILFTPHARLVHHARAPSLEGAPLRLPGSDPFFNRHLSPHQPNGSLRA